MIDTTFAELRAGGVSTKQACRLVGKSTATFYRCRQAPVLGPPVPRPTPVNATTRRRVSDGG